MAPLSSPPAQPSVDPGKLSQNLTYVKFQFAGCAILPAKGLAKERAGRGRTGFYRMPTGMSMPTFFYHVFDQQMFIDEEGTELPDFAAARREAVRLAAELLSEADQGFWTGGEWSMIVTDAERNKLLAIRFSGSQTPLWTGDPLE